MYKYAVVDYRSIVIDVITISDMNTLDGYQLPEGECALIDIRERLAIIGQTYNHELDKFE
jgi:hypothetical protein